MKVLIVSEGRSEHLSATSSHRREDDIADALMPLVRKIGRSCDEWQIDEDRVSNQNVRAFHGKGRGYEKRCVRWMLEAEKRGYDAIILLVDRDGIEMRITEINAAQDSTLSMIRRALGVAVESFDAWMLADHVAMSKVFGNNVQRQPDPERLPDPKATFRRLYQESQREGSVAEHYAEICTEADLEELKNRCPRGFAPFAERVQSL